MSLNEQAAERLYDLTAAQIDALAQRVYQSVVRRVRAGEAPQDAIGAALSEFPAGYYAILGGALGIILERSIGERELRQWRIGEITLSQRLYHGARETEARARRVIRDHAQFEHDARGLALELFEGYDFREDEPLNSRVRMPRYMRDAALEGDVAAQLARIQASRLRTGPLRAAYLQALDAILEGRGRDAMERALQVAIHERHRYFANRIAQTELHRSHTDQQARELMDWDEIEVVQFRLSASHPRLDECDLFAKQDKYGIGPGLYPKAEAPKPPIHPFCRCHLLERLDLSLPETAREREAAARTYLRGLNVRDGAMVAGSRARREAVLEGDVFEDVLNAVRPEGYQVVTIGQFVVDDSGVSGRR